MHAAQHVNRLKRYESEIGAIVYETASISLKYSALKFDIKYRCWRFNISDDAN